MNGVDLLLPSALAVNLRRPRRENERQRTMEKCEKVEADRSESEVIDHGDMLSQEQIENAAGTHFFKRQRDKKNPYVGPYAEAQELTARACIPNEYGQMAVEAAKSAGYDREAIPKHNLMCLAAGYQAADQGLRVIDAHALDFAGKPTGANGDCKNPRGAKWGKEATTDHEKLNARWFGNGMYPVNEKGEQYKIASAKSVRNVAYAVGEGMFVLDVDGDEGFTWLQTMETEHGPLPKTATVKTGSGGLHLYFHCSRPIKNSASAIAPKVDIRGVGGQALLPPSMHKSGNRYLWKEGCDLEECEIAHAPDWLEDAAFFATKANQPKATKKSNKKANTCEAKDGPKKEIMSGKGWRNHLADIGDAEGQSGFDSPIYRAACSYFSREGLSAPVKPLKEELVAAIVVAHCKDDRASNRYATDEYLDTRIEQAREFIAHQAGCEVGKTSGGSETELPHDYHESNGVFFCTTFNKGKPTEHPLCQEFKVIGRASNLDGDAGAGRIVQFENENGVTIEITMDRSRLFKNDGGGVLDELADAGMDLHFRGPKGRGLFLDLLRGLKSDTQIPIVPRPGWTRDRAGKVTGYMTPSGEYIRFTDCGPDMRLHSNGAVQDRDTMGVLQEWQEAASAARHNIHWTLGLCGGFAGVLVDLLEMQTCGINLSGHSSKGKTIALMLGSTVWATPKNGAGLLFVMNSTPNAVEDILTKGSGAMCGLDEIGAMQNPRALGSTLFGASSGSGKNRKEGRGAGLADTAQFRTFVMMTHEHSLKSTIQGAGGDYKAGLSVRFPDVDVTQNVPVSEDVLGKLDKASNNFGHAGPAFVNYLFQERWHLRTEVLKARVSAAANEIAGENAAPALRRAAIVFALVQVAGELAVEAEIIPDGIDPANAAQKAFKTFEKSDEGRATSGGDDLVDDFRSWITRSLGSSIIAADSADAPGYAVRYLNLRFEKPTDKVAVEKVHDDARKQHNSQELK